MTIGLGNCDQGDFIAGQMFEQVSKPSEYGRLQFKVVETTCFKVVCYLCRAMYTGADRTTGDYKNKEAFKKHLRQNGWLHDSKKGWHHNDCYK